MAFWSMVLWFCHRFIQPRCKRNYRLLFALFSLCGSACQREAPAELLVPVASPISTPLHLELREFSTLPPPTLQLIFNTPTPLPTVTPTPMPTPIVYTIQAGDTLLGIALKNFTTVEEIQALNPDVRPELLSIGHQLILPPIEVASISAEGATPIPIFADILQYAVFPDGGGGAWVLGKVRNSSQIAINNVALLVTLFDSSGEEIGSQVAIVGKKKLSIDEAAPFGLLFPQKVDGELQAKVSLLNGVADQSTDGNQAAFSELQMLEFVQDQRLLTTTVLLNPENGIDRNGHQILLTLYDSAEQVIGFSTHRLGETELGMPEIELTSFVIGGEVDFVSAEIVAK